jgi:hypothetical protein
LLWLYIVLGPLHLLAFTSDNDLDAALPKQLLLWKLKLS